MKSLKEFVYQITENILSKTKNKFDEFNKLVIIKEIEKITGKSDRRYYGGKEDEEKAVNELWGKYVYKVGDTNHSDDMFLCFRGNVPNAIFILKYMNAPRVAIVFTKAKQAWYKAREKGPTAMWAFVSKDAMAKDLPIHRYIRFNTKSLDGCEDFEELTEFIKTTCCKDSSIKSDLINKCELTAYIVTDFNVDDVSRLSRWKHEWDRRWWSLDNDYKHSIDADPRLEYDPYYRKNGYESLEWNDNAYIITEAKNKPMDVEKLKMFYYELDQILVKWDRIRRYDSSSMSIILDNIRLVRPHKTPKISLLSSNKSIGLSEQRDKNIVIVGFNDDVTTEEIKQLVSENCKDLYKYAKLMYILNTDTKYITMLTDKYRKVEYEKLDVGNISSTKELLKPLQDIGDDDNYSANNYIVIEFVE